MLGFHSDYDHCVLRKCNRRSNDADERYEDKPGVGLRGSMIERSLRDGLITSMNNPRRV